MSRPLKKFDGEPLGSFLMDQFLGFAEDWPEQKDFDKWAVLFSQKGYPIVANRAILSLLFTAAAVPEQLDQTDADSNRLLVALYKRSPDLFLSLLARLRKCLKDSTPHQRAILFASDHNATPKEIAGGLSSYVEYDAIKKARAKIQKLSVSTSTLKSSARDELDKKCRQHILEKYGTETPFRTIIKTSPTSKKARRRNKGTKPR